MNLVEYQIANQVKFLQLVKDKDDFIRETCLVRENLNYYSLRPKHALKGWQYYKHNNIFK